MLTKAKNENVSLELASRRFTMTLAVQSQLKRGGLMGEGAEKIFNVLTISKSRVDRKGKDKVRKQDS